MNLMVPVRRYISDCPQRDPRADYSGRHGRPPLVRTGFIDQLAGDMADRIELLSRPESRSEIKQVNSATARPSRWQILMAWGRWYPGPAVQPLQLGCRETRTADG
jgi:hypothetical protein